MKTLLSLLAAGLVALAPMLAAAAPLKLKPADPQPSSPKPGLSVRYAYPDEVKTLADAQAALATKSESGPPLKGLDYRDTVEGQKALTSKQEHYVAAKITGFVRFDAPGIYEIDFLTNDGLQARIGGQTLTVWDERTPCDTTRIAEVEVPQAGWYPVDILWFQRLATSCLHMRWAPKGQKLTWTPNAAFAR